MKEFNFESKQSIDEFIPENSHEIEVEEAKMKLKTLAEDISKHSSKTKDFSKIKEDFIQIQPVLERKIEEYIEREEAAELNFDIDREYPLYFELVNRLNLLSEYNKDLAARLFMLSDCLNQEIENDILAKREVYKSAEGNIDEQEFLPGHILGKFGFSKRDISDLIKSWLSVEDDESARWYIRQNLRNIKGLENFQEKSTKYLFDYYGIRGFGRYRMHELKEQYEARDSSDPYGIYFQAVSDHNGAFINENQSEALKEKVEDNSFRLRIVEADGKIDLAKRLLLLRDKYNQKIKFIYMHVHGNTDVIGLGDRDSFNSAFLKKDLAGRGVQRLKELFEDDAELILSSCLTGAKGGLAEEMADVFQVKVIASDKATSGPPNFIDVKKNANGNNLKFEIEFNAVDHDSDNINSKAKGTVIYRAKK